MEQRPIPRGRNANSQRAQVSRPDILEDEYGDEWPTRMPTSVRRYRSDVARETGRAQADVQTLSQSHYSFHSDRRKNIPQRRTASQTNVPVVQPTRRRQSDTEDVVSGHGDEGVSARGAGHRFHWLFYVGLAMLIMMIGWIALSSLLSWWQVTQDDWHYGRPRTFQTDAIVGHGDSAANPSHFIALNLHRRVEIIECPAGDCSKAKIYVGPLLIGQGQDLAVVTLSFKDVNGDGRPDMIVSVQGSRFVFINDNGAFRPQRPGDNVQLNGSSFQPLQLGRKYTALPFPS